MTSVEFRLFTSAQRAWMCAQLGWHVMPIVPKTKTPAIKNWPNKATTDIYVIDEWWKYDFPHCDVGILTGPESGIWVLDIDVHWCNGFKSLRDLFAMHGETKIPCTFRVTSPSGGQQWYFKYPNLGGHAKIRNVSSDPMRFGPLGAGLDVRGWHGQVVAPLGLGRDIVDDTLPIDAPGWLIELVTKIPSGGGDFVRRVESQGTTLHVLKRMAERLSILTAGRNSTLNTHAFQLGLLGARGLLDEKDARNALYEACVANGAIGGPDAWKNAEGQFEATFTSGWTAGLAEGAKR